VQHIVNRVRKLRCVPGGYSLAGEPVCQSPGEFHKGDGCRRVGCIRGCDQITHERLPDRAISPPGEFHQTHADSRNRRLIARRNLRDDNRGPERQAKRAHAT